MNYWLLIYDEYNFKIVDDNILIFNSGEEPISVIKLTEKMIEKIKELEEGVK